MYSKSTELAGLSLIALGVATLLGAAAGMIVGGVALLLIGSTTDDAQVTVVLKQGWQLVSGAWRRQVLLESLSKGGVRDASPHPQIHIDSETESWAQQAARNELSRVRLRKRQPAEEEESDLERLA